jgi:hypothetical protein
MVTAQINVCWKESFNSAALLGLLAEKLPRPSCRNGFQSCLERREKYPAPLRGVGPPICWLSWPIGPAMHFSKVKPIHSARKVGAYNLPQPRSCVAFTHRFHVFTLHLIAPTVHTGPIFSPLMCYYQFPSFIPREPLRPSILYFLRTKCLIPLFMCIPEWSVVLQPYHLNEYPRHYRRSVGTHKVVYLSEDPPLSYLALISRNFLTASIYYFILLEKIRQNGSDTSLTAWYRRVRQSEYRSLKSISSLPRHRHQWSI